MSRRRLSLSFFPSSSRSLVFFLSIHLSFLSSSLSLSFSIYIYTLFFFLCKLSFVVRCMFQPRECIGSCTAIVKGRAMRGGRARTEPSGGAPRSFMNGPPRLSHIWKRRVDRQPIPANPGAPTSTHACVRRASSYVCARVFIHANTS